MPERKLRELPNGAFVDELEAVSIHTELLRIASEAPAIMKVLAKLARMPAEKGWCLPEAFTTQMNPLIVSSDGSLRSKARDVILACTNGHDTEPVIYELFSDLTEVLQ